ncbi:MAG: LysR family transcriptional regulator, partial [Holophagaceae bacterium]
MDVRTLSTFCAAARTLNFTHAAAALGYAQSSVTAQIKSLEEDLGTDLFNRVGNRLELTEPGARFLIYAERILSLTQEAKASVLEEEGVGTLRFTGPESVCTYLLPRILRSFKTKFPRVRLQFQPGFVRDFKRQVLEGAVDFAFILEEPFPSKTLA